MIAAGSICPKCGQFAVKNSGRDQGELYCPNGCDLFTVQTPDWRSDKRLGQAPLGDGCYVAVKKNVE